MSDEGNNKTLDDFFAKKSKGKKKTKSKSKAFTTSQDIADKKQQTKSKAEEKVEAAPKVVSQVEEQWKDFEAPQEADYSGLRIQSLQLTEEKGQDEEGQASENTEEGCGEAQAEKASGPWVASSQGQPQAAAQEEAKVAARPTGRYIPGAFREKYKKERSGVPPDISSQAAFPSLLNTVSDSGKNRGDFETVKRGMKSSGSGMESQSSVNTENRYGSLQS